MPNYRHIDTTANAVIFANPNLITDTLRVSVKVTPKNINGAKLSNVRAEIRTNTPAEVRVGEAVVGSETVAIGTSISGSLENAGHVEALVRRHIQTLITIYPDAIRGWKPQHSAEVSADNPPVESE